MKVFFLSMQNSCRSQMAEAILRSFDSSFEIYSGGIKPADHISPVAIEVLADFGIELKQHEPQVYTNFEKLKFDYLITVGDGTNEELEVPPITFKRKMHLGFQNPYKHYKSRDELVFKCREICEEIFVELEYFYHHMLLPEEKENSLSQLPYNKPIRIPPKKSSGILFTVN